MDLETYSYKDLFDEPFLARYEKVMNILWWEIVRLNSTVYVLKRILGFDFSLFSSAFNKDSFWKMVKGSFYETCVLCLWKIDVDNDFEKGMTLNQIKNQILSHIKNGDAKIKLKSEIKGLNYGKNILEISNKVRIIRHNFIGHLNFDGIPTPSSDENVRISFDEISYFASQINDYFHLLCFKEQRLVSTLEYYEESEPRRYPSHLSDIEHLLELMVKESGTYKLPIDKPEVWEIVKKKKTKEEIDIINKYREKFGLEKLNA